MAWAEMEDLLSERDKQDKALHLQQANYNSALIQNSDAEKNYNEIQKTFINDTTADLKKKYKRYKMISDRLGIDFPEGEVIT